MSKAGKTTKNSSPTESEEKKSLTTVIYKHKDVKVKNITVSELDQTKTQPMAFMNYTNPKLKSETKLFVQSGKFKLTGGGIPRLSKPEDKQKFYESDDKREFIKIPLDPEYPACVEMRKLFEEVDEHFGSEEFRKKFFGSKRYSKYQYQKCIRTPAPRDDDSDSEEDDKKNKKSKKDTNKNSDKKQYPVFDTIKMKFNVVPEGNGRTNRTKLIKITDGKKKTITANTITEIANEIKFLSDLRIVYYFNKIWANKATVTGTNVKLYGVGIKVMAIEYTPSVSRGINPDDIAFMSEEEDDVSSKKSKDKKSPKLDDSDDNSDDDEESPKKNKNSDDDDEESEVEAKPSKKSKEDSSKKGKKPAKDDDDDSDEDAKASKKSKGKSKEESSKKGKKLAKDDDSEEEDPVDEDEDEEVKPSKSSKSKTKEAVKKGKNTKADDDNEDEEEEITPKKKSSKGKSSYSKK